MILPANLTEEQQQWNTGQVATADQEAWTDDFLAVDCFIHYFFESPQTATDFTCLVV